MKDSTKSSVATIPIQTIEEQAHTKAVKPYSKVAIALYCAVIFGCFISAYIRESGETTLANSNLPSNSEPTLTGETAAIETQEAVQESTPTPQKAATSEAATTSDKELFDRGEEHLRSSRWVLMMREFCSIPEGSEYFSPAKNQVAQLPARHQADVQDARNVVQLEKGQACLL